MKDLGSVWNNLNSLQKSQIGNDLFGKDNITVGYAILENYEKLDQVVNSLDNSLGSVDSEFNRYLDSTSGKIQQLKDTVLEMWSSFISSDLTKEVVKSLTKLVETFGNLKGILLVLGTAIGIFKGQAITGLITKFGLATKALGLFGATMKGIGVAIKANPIGIALTGLSLLIGFLGQAESSADRFNNTIQAFSKASDNFATAKENSALLTQYQDLETKLSSTQEGTQGYTQATKELHDVQVKLAESFPQLIDGFDAEGNALVRNTSKVQQAIKQQTEDTVFDMKNAIEQTKKVLEGYNDDYNPITIFGANKLLKNVSMDERRKYFSDGKGDFNTTGRITYEETYQMYRKVMEEGNVLGKEQSKLYDDAKEKLSKYNEEISKLYAQTGDINSVKKFKFFDFEEGEFVNAKTYFQELEQAQQQQEARSASMTAKIQAYSDAGLSATQISEKLGITIEDVTYAMGALGDETEDTTTAMENLSNSYSDNVNKAKLLQDVIEEFQESGGLSLETKDKIFSSDYQDIIQAMGDGNTFLQKAQSMLNDCMTEAEGLENKMLGVASSTASVGDASEVMATNTSENFNMVMKLLDALDNANAKEISSLAKQYNVDLKNKEISENEKQRLAIAILNNTDSATASMINSLGDKYGVDVENFTRAQQEKQKVLSDALSVMNYMGNNMQIGIKSGLQGKSPSELLKQQMEEINKKASTVMGVGTPMGKTVSSNYSAKKVGTSPVGTSGVGTTGVSPSSGGSSKAERDYSVENLDLKDYIESHYKLEDKIRDVQHQQDLLSKSIENTYGKNKINLQNQYINKLKEEQRLQKQLMEEQKKELGDLQRELRGYNAHFDNAGNMTNMTELYYHWITIANSINDSTEAGANQKKQAQEKVKYVKELVDKYRSLQEEIQSTESAYNDLSDSIKDVYRQMSDIYVEAEEKIASAISDYVEKMYDENSKALDKLRDKIDKTFEEDEHDDTVANYQKQLLEIRGSIEDAMKTGNNSLVKQLQEDYENAQKEYSDYMKNYEKDKALEKLDEEQEKLDKQKEDMLSSENLTKMIAQAMSEGFVNVNGTIVELNKLMTDFTRENTVGMQNLVNETADWNQTLMTAINTASQLSGINSSLGLNTSFAYTKSMQDSINKALKNVSTTTNKNLNVTSPLVVIENITSDNYNEIIDKVTSQIYNTLEKTLE